MCEIVVIIGCLGDCRGVIFVDIVCKKVEKEDDLEYDLLKIILVLLEKLLFIKKIVVGLVVVVVVIVIIVGGVFVVCVKKEV